MRNIMPHPDTPLHLLHLDSSARPGRAGLEPHGSWSRRLSHAFASRWRAARPNDPYTYRDLALQPPAPMPGNWVQAAFTPPAQRGPDLQSALTESDQLVAQLRAADVLVVGLPMYNYGMPAALKAWADLVVRIGETFDINRADGVTSYQPLLSDRPRRAVIATSRGAIGFSTGGEYAALNHADAALRAVLEFIGFTDIETVVAEGEETGGAIFDAAVTKALEQVDRLALRWSGAERPAMAMQAA
jgi:FMN-dependent NADH-azoreductase